MTDVDSKWVGILTFIHPEDHAPGPRDIRSFNCCINRNTFCHVNSFASACIAKNCHNQLQLIIIKYPKFICKSLFICLLLHQVLYIIELSIS